MWIDMARRRDGGGKCDGRAEVRVEARRPIRDRLIGERESERWDEEGCSVFLIGRSRRSAEKDSLSSSLSSNLSRRHAPSFGKDLDAFVLSAVSIRTAVDADGKGKLIEL